MLATQLTMAHLAKKSEVETTYLRRKLQVGRASYQIQLLPVKKGVCNVPNCVNQGWMRVFIIHMATYITRGDLITRPSYPIELTDAEWQLLEPEMPAPQTFGRPRRFESSPPRGHPARPPWHVVAGVALLRRLLIRVDLWACVWLRPTPGPDFTTRRRGTLIALPPHPGGPSPRHKAASRQAFLPLGSIPDLDQALNLTM